MLDRQISPVKALAGLLMEARDWQAALGEGDRPSLDTAIANATAILDAAKLRQEWVLQMDYNMVRGGEPRWQWVDSGVPLRAEGQAEALLEAEAAVKRHPTSKFIRGWRPVLRTELIVDAPPVPA